MIIGRVCMHCNAAESFSKLDRSEYPEQLDGFYSFSIY